jgi:hypothetical protein
MGVDGCGVLVQLEVNRTDGVVVGETDSNGLWLALNNHYLLIMCVVLVTRAIPADNLPTNLRDELHSMTQFAKLSGKETLHYAKHLVRGWWQDNSIKELKRLLLFYPWLKGVVIDYKNKLLPNSKFKAMNVFFSKSGISLLGAMIFWAGEKDVKGEKLKRLSVWFVDMIMANTTSQEMRDMMPGLEMVLDELQKPYLVEKAGETKDIFVLSNNALISAPLSPFIHAFNKYARSTPTTSNLEAAPNSGTEPRSTNSSSRDDANSENFGTTQSNNDLTAPSNGDDSNSAELDPETQLLLNQYLAKFNHLYLSKVGNWSSSVRRLISMWLTWEAQKGKSQLDTHFAYLNKQQATGKGLPRRRDQLY